MFYCWYCLYYTLFVFKYSQKKKSKAIHHINVLLALTMSL